VCERSEINDLSKNKLTSWCHLYTSRSRINIHRVGVSISNSAGAKRLSFRWCSEATGLIALSNPCVTRGSSFDDDFLGHRGCLRCRIHRSLVEAFSLMISEATTTQFSLMFWDHNSWLRCRIHASPVEAYLLMISEATGADCAVKSMRHPSKQFRWWFLSPYGLIALSNPDVTHKSSFVDYLWGQRGCLRCWIHVSPMEAVSLMISESLGAVCAIESMHHLWKKFRWWFMRPEGLLALSNPCVTCGSSFIDDFWGHMGYLRSRIHASPVKAVSLMIFEATGVDCTSNPCVARGSTFVDDFWVPRCNIPQFRDKNNRLMSTENREIFFLPLYIYIYIYLCFSY